MIWAIITAILQISAIGVLISQWRDSLRLRKENHKLAMLLHEQIKSHCLGDAE